MKRQESLSWLWRLAWAAAPAIANLLIVGAADPARAQERPESAPPNAEAGNRAADVGSRLVEQNDRAVQFLREHQYDKALELFRGMDIKRAAPAQRPLYRYNLGVALESSNDDEHALEQYRLAVDEDPAFRPAVDAAFRLVLRLNGEIAGGTAGQALELSKKLIDSGQAGAAGEQMKHCLAKWGDERWGPQIMNLMLRAYASASTTPDEFIKLDRPALASLTERPALRDSLRAIDSAFTLRAEAQLSDSRDRARFHAPGIDDKAMAALLKGLAAYYARRSDPEMALLRYSAAWQLDNQNADAAVNTAALLRDPARKLDPSGQRLRQFLNAIFDIKGGLYERLSSSEDHADELMRLHVVLGTIFQDDPNFKPQREIETPLFQWKRAAMWQERLRQRPGFVPSPDINVNLAKAYVKAGNKQQAGEELLKAAAMYAGNTDPAGANASLEALGNLGINLSEEQQRQMKSLERQVADLIKSHPERVKDVPVGARGSSAWRDASVRKEGAPRDDAIRSDPFQRAAQSDRVTNRQQP